MQAASTERGHIVPPPRARPWAAIAIAAAIIALYVIVLVTPTVGRDTEREHLHAAVGRLGEAIRTIEASYADGDLAISDRHLGLPASATFCRRLTLSLPETGHVRLACELRPTTGVHGTLVLMRSPQGAWRCRADSSHPQLLPAACSTQTFNES